MNEFYEKNIFLQWFVAISLLVIMMLVLIPWSQACQKNTLLFVTLPLIAPILQFCMTPFFTLIKSYTYLSPMLLVFAPSKKKYDLHNGTPFDYLMLMRNTKMGMPFRNRIFAFHLEGFLKIIEKVESGELPETVEITGSSYYFTDRTAKRLGFKSKPASIFAKLNLLLNYVDLFWMYSLAHGRIRFPKIFSSKKMYATGKELAENKANLISILKYIRRHNPKYQ